MTRTVHDYVNKDESRTNARGNVIHDGFLLHTERYLFDFEVCQAGWIQYDTKQDASYFGVWVHVEDRLTFTFCEGDTSLVVCPTIESFRAELENMQECYGDPPVAWAVIDSDNKLTRYIDSDARPEV